MTDQDFEDYFERLRKGLVNSDRRINWLTMQDELREKYSFNKSDYTTFQSLMKDWESKSFIVSSEKVKREVHEWIRDNLSGVWMGPYLDTSNINDGPMHKYIFEDEKDAVHFKLRWGN